MKPTTCLNCQYHSFTWEQEKFYCAKTNTRLPENSAWEGTRLRTSEEIYKAPAWCPLTSEAEKGEPNPFSNAIP